jgi:hypothetical protein
MHEDAAPRMSMLQKGDDDILDLPVQHRHDARLLPASLVQETRTVEVVWSTGAEVRRSDPWTGKPYHEVLSLEPGHVDLSRLEAGAPLLDSHAAFSLAGIIGVVERAWIEPGAAGPEGRAVIRFSSRAEVTPVWEDVRSGIIRHVSVGYRVRTFRIEEDADPPIWRAVDWQPVELSLVAVPADPGAGLRSDDRLAQHCRLLRRRDHPSTETSPMNDTITGDAPAAEAADDQETEAVTSTTDASATDDEVIDADPPKTRAAPPEVVVAPTSAMRSALAAERRRAAPAETVTRQPATDEAATRAIAERVLREERERVAGITDAARKLGIDTAVAEEFIRRGIGLDEARRSLIDTAAERDRSIETRPHHIRAGGQDEVTTRRAAVENALLHRYDPGRHALSEPARDWRGLSLIEMARSLLEAAGERPRGLSRDEIATRALHSTSHFPHILAAVTGKTLRAAYEAAPRTFMPIARRTSAADFKQIHRLQLGEAPQLEKVGESGEFKRGTIGEAKESYRVETWGKVIGITRQVIINDDLDAFTRVPALFGTSAATLESDIVWGIVIDNPAMADTNPLFHASHKNLASTGTALDVPSLGKARTAMAKQTGLDGKTLLNLRPTFLVVPAALELMAEQLIAQSLVPAKTTDVVPNSIRSLAVIAEPRLDPASGAVPWFLFASPAAIDTIEYAYHEGQDGVFIESRTGFDVDGVEIKARLDFGAKGGRYYNVDFGRTDQAAVAAAYGLRSWRVEGLAGRPTRAAWQPPADSATAPK